jgi:lactoylglutathione lyase
MAKSKSGVVLSVARFHECIHFYRDKIGLEISMEKPGIVRFQLESMYLQIEDGISLEIPISNNVIIRENVPSISDKRQELLERGVVLEVHDLEWGEIGFALDPHGNKFEYLREK